MAEFTPPDGDQTGVPCAAGQQVSGRSVHEPGRVPEARRIRAGVKGLIGRARVLGGGLDNCLISYHRNMSDTPLTKSQLLAQIAEEQKLEKEFEQKEEAWLTVVVASHRTFCNCTNWKAHLYQLLKDSISDKWQDTVVLTGPDVGDAGDHGGEGTSGSVGDTDLIDAADEAEAADAAE